MTPGFSRTYVAATRPPFYAFAEKGKRHSAERGTERARNIHADTVGGDGGGQVVLRNESRNDGLPRRYGQDSGGADEEREQQQISGCSPTKAHNHRIDSGNYRR